jgi:alpha-1,4-digalacturonate transport system permease protein
VWLNDAGWAFFWSVLVSIWAHMGFYTLILLAGLQAIPADLFEAAQMDHASPWRRFYRITLPLLMPNLLVVVVLALIRAVQIFDEIFVLTGGGPGSATLFIVQFIYQTAFSESIRLYGLAAAASLVLAASLLVLTLAQLGISRQGLDRKTGRDDG